MLAALAGWSVWVGETDRAALRADGMPVSSELEEQSGARFTGLYMVDQGGLVELRYRVIDASKARDLGHYAETSPHLIAEDSGERIEAKIVGLRRPRVEAGPIHYILYWNTTAGLHPGSLVTIQLGDLCLEHVRVQ